MKQIEDEGYVTVFSFIDKIPAEINVLLTFDFQQGFYFYSFFLFTDSPFVFFNIIRKNFSILQFLEVLFGGKLKKI